MQRQLSKNLQRGLVLWLPGVVNGTTATDMSGSGNNGTITGSPSTQRTRGYKGWIFDGTNKYIQCSNKVVTSGTQISVSCWIYNKSTSQAIDKTIFSNQGIVTNFYGCVLTQYDSPGNAWNFFYGSGTNTTWYGLNANKFSFPLNQWTHFVGTIDGAVMKIYLNGVLLSSATYGASISFANAGNFTLCEFPGIIGNRSPNLNIFNQMVWNRILSNDEIMQTFTETFIP